MSSLLGAFVLSFTVILVVAIGILAAYATVIAILHAFVAPSRQRSSETPVLVSGQAHAAHAGGA